MNNGSVEFRIVAIEASIYFSDTRKSQNPPKTTIKTVNAINLSKRVSLNGVIQVINFRLAHPNIINPAAPPIKRINNASIAEVELTPILAKIIPVEVQAIDSSRYFIPGR